MKNPDYKLDLTLTKGGKQFINVISSTAFSAFLAVLFKELSDKEFNVTDIKSIIENLSGTMLFLVPFVSAIIRMILNFKDNYFQKNK